jgi:hypothetical protein
VSEPNKMLFWVNTPPPPTTTTEQYPSQPQQQVSALRKMILNEEANEQ